MPPNCAQAHNAVMDRGFLDLTDLTLTNQMGGWLQKAGNGQW